MYPRALPNIVRRATITLNHCPHSKYPIHTHPHPQTPYTHPHADLFALDLRANASFLVLDAPLLGAQLLGGLGLIVGRRRRLPQMLLRGLGVLLGLSCARVDEWRVKGWGVGG